MAAKNSNQATNFYIRLNSTLPSEKPHLNNTVSNFENKLNHTVHLADYKLALTDIHIKGTLDSLTLNRPEDYKFTIYETIPSYEELNELKSIKFHSTEKVSEMLNRYLDISDNWKHVSNDSYSTTILTSVLNREEQITLKTDFILRTDLGDYNFLTNVDKIAKKTPVPNITNAKAEIELVNELQFFDQDDENVSFTYNDIKRKMSVEDFEDLLALRIRELKKKNSNLKKQELLEREIKKLPETQKDRKTSAMSLSKFLDHIRATLNLHPLYSFFSWNYEKIPDRNKYNVKLSANRTYDNFDDPCIIRMVFNEKTRKMLQKSSKIFNPMTGLRNVAIDEIIEVEYDSAFPVYIECSEIEECLLGKREKPIIKSIMLKKNRNKKVEYAEHFSILEYHYSAKYNITSAIRIKLLDTSGYPIQFKNGEIAITLHTQKKSPWEM